MERKWDIASECVVCGEELTGDRLLTCSHDCYMEYKSNKTLDAMIAKRIWNGKLKARLLVCEYCKTQFRPYRPRQMHVVYYKPKFCSVKCKEESMKESRRKAREFVEKLNGPK